jgi:hypothetical protein
LKKKLIRRHDKKITLIGENIMQLLKQTTTKTIEQSNDDVNHAIKPHRNLTMVWTEECQEGHCRLAAKWVLE